MSNPDLTAFMPGRGEQDAQPSTRAGAVRRFYDRYTPSQGWATFVILILMLMIVGHSVTAARWVYTPGMSTVLFLSAAFGLALAKTRLPWFLMPPVGLALGTALTLRQVSFLAEDEGPLNDRLREIFSRLDVWYEAATTGGISTDVMPFALVLISAAWILGFFSAWFIFRNNNIWFAVVFGGIAMLTNLSFLPDRFSSRFFLFVLIAMILVVRMSIIERHELWRRVRIGFSPATGWLTLHATLWFSIAVILIAALLPLRIVVAQPVVDLWNIGRTPVASLEDVFVRLFSTLPSRKDLPGRFFGKTLPFMGEISFGGEVVAWATTRYPSYWLAQAYNHYTSQGWIASETEHIEIGPEILPPPRFDGLKRAAVDQTIQLGFDSNKFMTGGGFDWVSLPAVAESLAPKKFDISIEDETFDAEYPQDIRAFASQIRGQGRLPRGEAAHSFIAGTLPHDLVLLDVHQDSAGEVEFFTLQRKAPIQPDLVSWHFDRELPENSAYRMVSMVSMASNDDLREADADYNSFVTDHYLQLPSSLPDRVRDLAQRLTAAADNPLDKALAVQDYLRGGEFVYSQEIEAPPRGADGVDHFLFESKTGYSDYFGSSMAVLLRAAGVPARLAAGYAPGERHEKSGQLFIRDSDSHGWVQVYFPEYGWIDFEPTPNWDLHPRGIGGRGGAGSSDSDVEVDPDPLIRDFIDPFMEAILDDPGVLDDSPSMSIDLTRYLAPAGIALGSAAALYVLVQILWNFGLGGMTVEEKTYAKMGRLGWLAGVGRQSQQTPWEYASAVGLAVHRAAEGARTVGNRFSVSRYGHRESDDSELEELAEAWKNVRIGLLARVFGRLVPQGNQQTQSMR